MNHTPEPWRLGRLSHILDYDRVLETVGPHQIVVDNEFGPYVLADCNMNFKDDAIANARRIVACVNACAGVPLEWLESGLDGCVQGVREERDQYQSDNVTLRTAIQTQAEEAAKLMAQRDELLAAAKNLRDVKGRHHSEQAFNRLCDVVEAITNATKVEA